MAKERAKSHIVGLLKTPAGIFRVSVAVGVLI